MTKWWVLGTPDRQQFVGWSCGSMGGLDDAAVYRSRDNAEKKLKVLMRNMSEGEDRWPLGLEPVEITVSL